MDWNPETSSWELPPTNNITTPPPELFPPETPPEGVCANTAKPGDLISIAYPNETQVIYTIVGDVEIYSEADVRSMEWDAWGRITFSDHWWYPQTMDSAVFDRKIYSPPVLQIPMPSGVTPDMVTDGMIMAGSREYVAAGLACAIASETDFKGIKKRTCYHEDNTVEAESAWAGIEWPESIDVVTSKSRKILTEYVMTITFPFPVVHDEDEPLVVPVMASLALVSFLLGAAAGAGVAPTAQRRKHVSFE